MRSNDQRNRGLSSYTENQNNTPKQADLRQDSANESGNSEPFISRAYFPAAPLSGFFPSLQGHDSALPKVVKLSHAGGIQGATGYYENQPWFILPRAVSFGYPEQEELAPISEDHKIRLIKEAIQRNSSITIHEWSQSCFSTPVRPPKRQLESSGDPWAKRVHTLLPSQPNSPNPSIINTGLDEEELAQGNMPLAYESLGPKSDFFLNIAISEALAALDTFADKARIRGCEPGQSLVFRSASLTETTYKNILECHLENISEQLKSMGRLFDERTIACLLPNNTNYDKYSYINDYLQMSDNNLTFELKLFSDVLRKKLESQPGFQKSQNSNRFFRPLSNHTSEVRASLLQSAITEALAAFHTYFQKYHASAHEKSNSEFILLNAKLTRKTYHNILDCHLLNIMAQINFLYAELPKLSMNNQINIIVKFLPDEYRYNIYSELIDLLSKTPSFSEDHVNIFLNALRQKINLQENRESSNILKP